MGLLDEGEVSMRIIKKWLVAMRHPPTWRADNSENLFQKRVFGAVTVALFALSTSVYTPQASASNPDRHHDNNGHYYGHHDDRDRDKGKPLTVIKNMEATCSALMNVKLPKPGLSVTSAVVRDSGLATEHCAVSFTFTLPNGQIVLQANHFYPKTYSGRFLQTGGGGFWPGLSDTADATTMSNHMAQGTFGGAIYNDLLWVDYNHFSEANLAFSTDGIYYSTIIGQHLSKAFYGKKPAFTYYSGCSRGGEQGLEQALHHPDAFDGIAVGAPAFIAEYLAGYTPRLANAVNQAPNLIFGALGAQVAQEIYSQCDGLDGVADGVISNPELCHPDFTAIFNNLNPSSIERQLVLDAFVSHSFTGNPVNPAYGTVTMTEYGMPITATRLPVTVDNFWTVQDSWAAVNPNFPASSNGDSGAVAGSVLGYNFSSQAYADTMADIYVSPMDGLFTSDLNKFAQKGGKLVIVHTWADQLLPITNSIGWVNKQKQVFKLGSNKLRDNMRFFTKQDGGHCDFDGGVVLASVEDWVENKKAPDSLVGIGKAPFDRPACEYPLVPMKKDQNGSLTDPNNWKCATPEKVAQTVTPVVPVPVTVAQGIAAYNSQPSVTYNGHEYKYVPTVITTNSILVLNVTWTDARSICQGLGAGWDLASVHSDAENTFITDTVMGPTAVYGYLGGAEESYAGKWYWVDDPSHLAPFWDGYGFGLPIAGAYANWDVSNGEPNHYQGLFEQYVAIFGHSGPSWGIASQWMDVSNDNNMMPPVCKK